MKLLLLLLVAACDSAQPSCDFTPAVCVPDQYDYAIVTDAPPGSCVDSRCLAKQLWYPGDSCTFPGVACEYFDITIGCGCDGIVRCVKSSNPQFHPTGCPGAFAFDMSMPDRGD
jgi:hypothetical protein